MMISPSNFISCLVAIESVSVNHRCKKKYGLSIPLSWSAGLEKGFTYGCDDEGAVNIK